MRTSSHNFLVDSGETPVTSLDGYRVMLVTSVAELEKYADPWDRLVANAPNRVHTISHAWIASFLDHLVGSESGYACLLAFEDAKLIGAMPLLLSRKYWSLLTKSEVCPPTSPQTFASDLVCRANDANKIVDVMVQALDCFLPRAWELEFHHVSECSPVVRHFSNGSSSLLSAVELDGYGNIVRATGSFDEYFGSLRPKFARNLKRLERKIRGLPAFQIETLRGVAAGPGNLDEFLELEASGWKGQTGTAINKDPRQEAFYRDFTRRLYDRGWLEWHLLHAEGRVIASHMAARIDPVLYLWKIAYDENYRAYAPGNILMVQTIKNAFESANTEEVNYLTNSAWNQNWNMTHRGYYNVTVWPKRALPFLAGYCRKKSKNLLRKVPFAKRIYHALRNGHS